MKELQETHQTINKLAQVNLESDANQNNANEIFKTLFCKNS